LSDGLGVIKKELICLAGEFVVLVVVMEGWNGCEVGGVDAARELE